MESGHIQTIRNFVNNVNFGKSAYLFYDAQVEAPKGSRVTTTSRDPETRLLGYWVSLLGYKWIMYDIIERK